MPLIHTTVRGYQEDGAESLPSPSSGLVRRRTSGTSAFTAHHDEQMGDLSKSFRFQLKLVIVIAMCVFTVGPAIALWMVSWQTGNNGINSINSLGQSSVEAVTLQLRSSTMRSTQSAFMALVQPSEDLSLTSSYRLKGTGVLGN
eukprot:RCo008465